MHFPSVFYKRKEKPAVHLKKKGVYICVSIGSRLSICYKTPFKRFALGSSCLCPERIPVQSCFPQVKRKNKLRVRVMRCAIYPSSSSSSSSAYPSVLTEALLTCWICSTKTYGLAGFPTRCCSAAVSWIHAHFLSMRRGLRSRWEKLGFQAQHQNESPNAVKKRKKEKKA